jgi:hypothetical protein
MCSGIAELMGSCGPGMRIPGPESETDFSRTILSREAMKRLRYGEGPVLPVDGTIDILFLNKN